jgi:hypothetical protein
MKKLLYIFGLSLLSATSAYCQSEAVYDCESIVDSVDETHRLMMRYCIVFCLYQDRPLHESDKERCSAQGRGSDAGFRQGKSET